METWLVMLIAILGASGVLIPYYIISKRKEKVARANDKRTKEEKEKEDKLPSVECRIYDTDLRLAYNTQISGTEATKIREKQSNLGRKWLKDGKWVFALTKDKSGEYKPVAIPFTMEDPPSSLHRALMQQAVDEYYDMTPDKNFLQQHGKILLFVGAVLFLLWTVIMG